MATARAPKAGARRAGTKRKERKNIPHGVASIAATFNNTIVAITDPVGNILSWSSAGRIGFKGSRKGTPFAAQVAAQNAAQLAQEHGIRSVDVKVKGPGAGRESAVARVTAAQADAASGDTDVANWIRQVGRPLIDGFSAFARGQYAAAVEALHPVRFVAQQFGGSHAQRDVIDWTLTEAAIRAVFDRLLRQQDAG